MRAETKARAFVAATITLGVVVVGASALHVRGLPLATLALLGAGVFLTELVVVPRDETSFDLRDTTSFAFSASIHIAAVILLGLWAAALVAAFGVVAADGLRRRRLKHVAFNASAEALAAAAGGAAFVVLGGTPGSLSLPQDFPAIVVLAAVVYTAGALLVVGVIALERKTAFRSTARETMAGAVAAAVGEAGVGVALAAIALHEPWAILALFPLLAAVYQSHARLVTLRRETARALETFANVVDERDRYTFQHSARVAEFVRSLAESLDLPARIVAELRWAGRLHDLGKISVDAAVLRKPSKLDAAEWNAMRLHPRLSARLLRRFRLASEQAKAVEYHHERMDGTGYYDVDAAELPLGAHFLVLADSFDAMTTDRPYRAALPEEAALAEIERNAGSQFHPLLAKAFVALRRGEDPLAALTAEEHAEVLRLAGRRTDRTLRRSFQLPWEWVAAGALVVALLAVAAGLVAVAVPAVFVALAGLVADRLDDYRAHRLAANVRQMLAEGLPANAVFIALVSKLSLTCDLRWAGLFNWGGHDYQTELALEWRGGAPAPPLSALTSWLVREADSSTELLVAKGAELGRPHPHLVVPLRRGESVAGYLVLAVEGRIPRAVREALEMTLEALARGLVPATEPTLVPLQAVS